MGANIVVGNKVGGTGEISGITSDSVNYTHNESFLAWVAKFPNRPLIEYHRNFSIVKVSDKTVKDLTYLTAPLIINGDPVGNKWYFIVPDSNTPEWLELFQTGEITKTFDEVLLYIRERN